MHKIALVISALVFVSVSSAWAADARNGEVLARRWCAACHVVAPDQREPAGEALPFASVAKRPNFDAHQLAFFLLNPHPKMPDMGLSRSAAEDLSAYIVTLNK